MGRVAVRNAIQAQIQGLGIPYLGSVYAARPVILEEQAYVQTMSGLAVPSSANGSSCVVVVNMPNDHRERIADTGRGTVQDTDIHKVVLELFFASVGGDGVSAQLDYDSIIDALIIAIRANPTPGGASVVWSAGEFASGVDHEQGQPLSSADGLTIFIVGTIRYDAYEWLAGSGV